MELTGKCKEESERGFENKYYNNNTSKVSRLQSEFGIVPFEFKYGVMCSFFIWIKQKLCRHKKYEQGYWGELHIRKCNKCELIDVEVVLSKNNGFLKIK